MKLKYVEIRKFLTWDNHVLTKRHEETREVKDVDENLLSEMLCGADLAGVDHVVDPDRSVPVRNDLVPAIRVFPNLDYALILIKKPYPDSAFFKFKNGWICSIIDEGVTFRKSNWIKKTSKTKSRMEQEDAMD